MPSIRNNLIENVNGSKNTRMDLDKSAVELDYRKDEIMFIGRYHNGASTMIDLSKKLGRPIRVLDLGCGQMNTVRLFYRSYVCKKSDVIDYYLGIDIDNIMAKQCEQDYHNCYNTCNAHIEIQDLTVNPHLAVSDGYFDLIICTEFLEHINPKFSQAIIEEAYRVLNPDGVALFSTPNSNGSNETLPKDHFYEYAYEELVEKIKNAGFNIDSSVGMCINISRIPKEIKEELKELFETYDSAFGRNSAFTSVAIAPLIEPKYCKNVLYRLSKTK